MKQQNVLPSAILKMFLDFIENVKSDYDYNFEAMKNEDRITQDYLHKLELEGLNCRERSKVATRLAANRQARRNHKDVVEKLEPIVAFFNEPQNRRLLNNMTQLLGQVRKVENHHSNRIYVPRVISDDAIKTEQVSQEQV